MGLIAAVLARKIAPAVAVLGAWIPFVLGSEAFQGSPGLDQGPIHRKMFLTQQASPVEHANHFGKKLVGDLVFQEPLLVFAEGARIERLLLELQVQKPLE